MSPRQVFTTMTSPYYAVVIESEVGHLWWKRTVYTWRVRFYGPAPDYVQQIGLEEGEATSRENGIEQISRVLSDYGFKPLDEPGVAAYV